MDFERLSRGQSEQGRVSLERNLHSTALRWSGVGPEPVVVGRPRAAHLDDARLLQTESSAWRGHAVLCRRQVLESHHPYFKPGDLVPGDFGR
jgi:hypothetical protein